VAYSDLAAASHEGARHGARRADVLKLGVKPSAPGSGRCGPGGLEPAGGGGARGGGGGASTSGGGGPPGGGPPGGGPPGGGEGWSVAFQDFEGAGGLDSALALIHHLAESHLAQ
jgi:hypothetical protein